jgi:CHAD domain-containing protein
MEMTMRQYAVDQVAQRLRRVAFELKRAKAKMDDEAVHDLRVSIRRFSQSLRVFSSLLPKSEARKIRKKLRRVMKIAGEVRNLDIAAQMVAESKIRGLKPLLTEITESRKELQRQLLETLRQLANRDFTTRWRERLQLEV